jgi:hypothetical protein
MSIYQNTTHDIQNDFSANDNISEITSIHDCSVREAVKFLEKLRPGGPWLLTAIVPDGPATTETMYSAEEVRNFVREHNGQRNIYYSVNPARAEVWKKTAKIDIARIEFALADLDPRNDETAQQAKDRYLDTLEQTQPHPTAIIDSGNGLQVLWRLDQPIILGEPIGGEYSPEDQARIEDVEARGMVTS